MKIFHEIPSISVKISSFCQIIWLLDHGNRPVLGSYMPVSKMLLSKYMLSLLLFIKWLSSISKQWQYGFQSIWSSRGLSSCCLFYLTERAYNYIIFITINESCLYKFTCRKFRCPIFECLKSFAIRLKSLSTFCQCFHINRMEHWEIKTSLKLTKSSLLKLNNILSL